MMNVISKEAKPNNEELVNNNWELVTDFTKIKRGGVDIDEVLSCINLITIN